MTSEASGASPRPAAENPRLRSTLVVLLALLAGSTFVPSLAGEFLWDDIPLISGNPYLASPGYFGQAVRHFFPYTVWPSYLTPTAGMYRPVIAVVDGIEFQLFGMETWGYHLINIGLHVACVVLAFFWILRRLGVSAENRWGLIAAFLGTLIFAIHPSRTESVSWITGNTDLWMSLCVLLGLTVWDRFESIGAACLVGALFALALLSKELAAVVPFVVVLDEWLRGRPRSLRWAIVVAIPVAVLLWRASFFPAGVHIDETPGLFTEHVLAAIGSYARIVVCPWPASTEIGYLDPATPGYPLWSITTGAVVICLLLTMAAVAAGRATLRPFLADALWFFVLLVPVVISINHQYLVNERHLYLPLLGIAALVARVLGQVLSAAPWVVIGMALLEADYITGAAVHAGHFASGEALWTNELREHPRDIVALTALKGVASADGHFEEARDLAARALHIVPDEKTYGDWLEADFRLAQRDDTLLAVERRTYDKLVAGEIPEGAAGTLYALMPPKERAKLGIDRTFRVHDAQLLWATGDRTRSIAELRVLAGEPSSDADTDAIAPLVVELVADGAVDEAEVALNQASGGSHREALHKLVAEAREIEAAHLPAPEALVRLTSALIAANEPFVAFELLRTAPASTASADGLANRVLVEMALRRYAEADRDISALKVLAPDKAAQYLNVLNALSQADGPEPHPFN